MMNRLHIQKISCDVPPRRVKLLFVDFQQFFHRISQQEMFSLPHFASPRFFFPKQRSIVNRDIQMDISITEIALIPNIMIIIRVLIHVLANISPQMFKEERKETEIESKTQTYN